MTGELVLVSGVTGFVGSWVCKKAMEHGYRVRGTVRSLRNKEKVSFLENLCPGAQYPLELVEADLLNEESWTAAVKDCKYVLHTASPFQFGNPRNPDDFIKPAVDGTLNVLKAAANAGTVKRVVITSSLAANWRGEKQDGICTEEDWSVPEKQESIYERSKTLAELAAWKYVKDLPEDKAFELCTVQPVGIQGPVLHKNPGASVDVCIKLMNGEIPMLPKFYFPLVDVRDVAEAHIRCLEVEEAGGKRVIIFTDNVFYPELAKWLSDEFKPQGYNVSTRVMPNWLMKFMSVFNGELRGMRSLVGKKREISNTRMRDLLGISPTNLKQATLEMVYSLIEIGSIKKTSKYKGPNSSSSTAEEN